MRYSTIRPVLFRLDAERSHDLVIRGLRIAGSVKPLRRSLRRRQRVADPRLVSRHWGLTFPSPVGLAAGFDKNAEALAGVGALGFGFAEVGTVTPRPQPGNPKPRMFRHPEHESLQNALGFNNAGMHAMRRRLERAGGRDIPIGINVGKNKDTPQERAAEDYLASISELDGVGDYFVVNLSSPNTPGLRDLQSESWIVDLLSACRERTQRPILVKLSPDLSPDTATDLSRSAVGAGAAGVILTNTTTDYSLIPEAAPIGGLSGRALRAKSFEILRHVAGELPRDRVIISVGGIDSGAEAYRRLRAGASLIQVYSALVFHGPGLVRSIQEELSARLVADGAASVADVVGADLR